ncbi:NADH dehydrogenase subunit 5 [Leptospirillum ferriphilum]|jgi:NAD(P)H-quinone oxidoreductase subunit 5|uniref:Probable inorganic carbon transporter subunit DabB n=2 Tax=Leptospirillum ferriphilum TaxID=178606 RepID=A0A094YJ45_9BACT|nr:proton-conducting transporter membrane subunit [Leptospirillum ferriphilum]AFS54010.1 NADH ubiquinone oxidoreductase subunit 5 chain L [Leptospirillum ferriphilum ML-04]KGA93231.1 NADH dehydrogenase subunit 5 [Leptospirillum ferriphilum]OOH70348.1 NADH dehydrogenase [Leptospirillum ferriphilum]
MTDNMSTLASAMMLVTPWPLLLSGLVLGFGAGRHPRFFRKIVYGSAVFALTSAIASGIACAIGWSKPATYFSFALPDQLGAFEINISVNALTVTMLLLVAFVGMIVSHYSRTYMDGDPREGQFHRWLALTLGSFFTLIVVGNMWAFFVSWIATSLFLHELLAFYRDRPGAILAARKKYVLHRVADASLLGAIVLLVRTLHTPDFSGIGPALLSYHGTLPAGLFLAGGLIVLAAILKSAQFPFHGWLIQVMEAPTPVSALLHAGIIYTGAFLVLRMSPLLSLENGARDTLVLTGLLSIALTSLMMVTETNIKESLAYSTCAQMGFMLMECGLGLYTLAVLHIVSHSVYKAHAFLASGSVVDHFRAPALSPASGRASTLRAILGLSVGLGMTFAIGSGFGISFSRQPALVVLGVILSVAVSRLMLQALDMQHAGTGRLFFDTALLSAAVCTAYFGLHRLFDMFLGTLLPAAPFPETPFQSALLGAVSGVFLGLFLVQQFLSRILEKPFGRAAYVHLYNGFYVDILIARLVREPAAAQARLHHTQPSRTHQSEVLS